MNQVDGGICAPRGYQAAGVAARIKGPQSAKKDCALLVSGAPASVAGTFTTNVVKAAPVLWCQEVCRKGRARAVFINSGNANACTGERGAQDARETARRVAGGLNIPEEEVLIASTGVIGVPLPMERVMQGVDGCLAAISPAGNGDAARAIMTTDTVPKETAVEVALAQGVVRVGAMVKGAGMIAPNMATMICVITTDAAIAAKDLQAVLRASVEQSFNRICVDNDMSTNDTVLCLANGQAGLPALEPGAPDYESFADALRHVCRHMAQALVRDGEGATKFVEVRVEGARGDGDARAIARSIAMSQLCKTAFNGSDPNWGRIACAAGYAGVAFDPARLDIWVGDLQVLTHGLPAVYEEAAAAERMRGRDIALRVSVGDGPGTCTYWTSDLSKEYVSINADYRS
ncbi:MAG: bifunctional glutamate N-acetyltransferase/amino-acid acetyltransferase ArgJ [Candidatus Hydrogenedentes bacterium]|nr:bifunctional glutamate N-acetyltransferase/amino-acid acetyltransferase ArgJ [Candidatus Hydrogenedentota bacterium]